MSSSRWNQVGVGAVIVVISVLVSVATTRSLVGGASAARPETAYERVLRTNTIRVGYVNYPPGTIVSPQGGDVSGIFPDLIRRIGKDTGLEVKFTEEVGWATLIEGLQNGRYDIIGGVWANPDRGKVATVSIPLYYSGIGVWVRSKETRFSPATNWASINSADVKLGAIDGSTPLTIAQEQFTSAHLVTYPNLTTEPQLFLDLTQKKIDVFFAEPSQGLLFLKANPGTIKNIASDHPLRVFPDVILMKSGEFQFKTMIDTAVFDLESRGVVDDLIRKYEPAPGSFYPVASPYTVPSNSQ